MENRIYIPRFQKIETLAALLKSLIPMKPADQKRLDKKISLEFNYNSNHMEGNTLTYGETKLLLFFGRATGKHDMRELDEMRAHDAAFETVKLWAGSPDPLTEADIKNLHKVLLVEPFWKEGQTADGQPTRVHVKVGEYKSQANSVIRDNGEEHFYTSPQDTPIKMAELVQWLNGDEAREMRPELLAAIVHWEFASIHPFDDGNGRMARLLANYILMKHGLPPVIIKSAGKKQYIIALNEADAGNLDAFVDYIADQLLWSLELCIKAAKGEDLEEDGDVDKEIAVWKKRFSAAPIAAIPRSDDEVYKVYETSIAPLLQRYVRLHRSFSSLFQSMKTFGMVNNASGGNNDNGFEYIDGVMQQYYTSLGGFLDAGEAPQPQRPNFFSIRLQVELRGFKMDGTNVFDCIPYITIDFQQYKWIITINNADKTEKLYEEVLTDQEIKEIVKKAVTWTQGMIESQLSKNKKEQ